MKKTILAITSFILCLTASGQVRITLEDAIRMAQDGTYIASQAENDFNSKLMEFEFFASTFKPHLDLTINPNLVKRNLKAANVLAIPETFNAATTQMQLTLTQKSAALGGDFYLSSSGIWTEHFDRTNNYYPRIFGYAPVVIGYRQDLLGYNSHKWDRELEDARMELATREVSYSLNAIGKEAALLFINATKSSMMYNMYRSNTETSEFLYEIGKAKFEIGSIRNDELYALELQMINARNSTTMMETEYRMNLESLRSFLQMDPAVDVELVSPEINENLILDREKIYNLVRNNNPVFSRNDTKIIESKQKEEKARIEKGLRASVDLNVGFQNYDKVFGPTFNNKDIYSSSGITLSIPIINQKTAEKKYNAARYNSNMVESRANEEIRELMTQVDNAMLAFEHYKEILKSAQRAVELADETYEQANENYANGIADINTFAITQSRKNDAYTNLINARQRYWEAYLSLEELCGTKL